MKFYINTSKEILFDKKKFLQNEILVTESSVLVDTVVSHPPFFHGLSGIKLRKVEKIEQKEVERVNALNDVASILARRVAVEFSDSDSASESECDSEGWGEQESNLA